MDHFQQDLNGIWIWNPLPAEGETVLWEGADKDGYAHGEGVLYWYFKDEEISSYKGTMHAGKPSGWGRYVFADGDIYEGDWKDGLRHGYGKQWYKDGRIYEGQWSTDKKDESGTLS